MKVDSDGDGVQVAAAIVEMMLGSAKCLKEPLSKWNLHIIGDKAD